MISRPIRRISFLTLGCRLNQSEEEKLRRQFSEAGFFVSKLPEADLIIVNTCSVTQLADKKSRQKIRGAIKINPSAKMVVMGCGVNEAKKIRGIDLFIDNKDKNEAFKIIAKKFSSALERPNSPKDLGNISRKNHLKLPYSDLSPLSKTKSKDFASNKKRTRALLKVQDGCNNFCTYCIVPYLRGREVSVPLFNLIEEAKKLDEMGYRELVISGVNVGRYSYKTGNRKVDLAGLIKEILKNTNFPRLRLSSVNPQDITPKIIDLWAQEERLCKHLHLSLQSGSNSVLKRMRRPYTTEKYAEVVRSIREKMPDIAITTDVIVGFPGETAREFEETCEFVESLGFAKLHVFPYSIRRGTKAAEMSKQIDKKTKKERAEKLRKIGDKLYKEYRRRFIGRELPVLFEERKDGYWYGLTSNYIRVKYQSKDNLTNKILNIELSKDNII